MGLEKIVYLFLSVIMMYIVWSSRKILQNIEDAIKELKNYVENVNKEATNTSKIVSILLTEHYKNHPDSKVKEVV